MKNKVFKKSQGCCEYVGHSGVRCNSRYQIQIDHHHHHHAFSLGGNNSNQNLRNWCARHNRIVGSEQGIGFETTSHYYVFCYAGLQRWTANKKTTRRTDVQDREEDPPG